MIPIHDDSPKGFFPLVNIILIIINVIVFIRQPHLTEAAQKFFMSYGFIPDKFIDLVSSPASADLNLTLSVFSSIFIHGDLMHLLSNMLFLWIFGDNIEYILGHFKYFFFYLLCGIIATFSHVFVNPDSTVPVIGASGAISGVLGAYMLKFPRNRVTILFFIFIFFKTVRLPAIVLLSLWFVYQVVLGYMNLDLGNSGGIAWFAHIGGFVSGVILILLFNTGRIKQIRYK